MAHNTDPSLFSTFGFGSSLINVPMPGDSDIGGNVSGLVNDILQRLPLPRRVPRLPAPTPGPTGQGPRRTPFPLPIPIPVPDSVFNGGAGECAPNPCCRGQHLDKATGTKCVTNRRMNVANIKALKRAIRRAKGFERVVKSNRKALRSLSKI